MPTLCAIAAKVLPAAENPWPGLCGATKAEVDKGKPCTRAEGHPDDHRTDNDESWPPACRTCGREHQPRERPVQCRDCGGLTFNHHAICHRCDRPGIAVLRRPTKEVPPTPSAA